MILLLLLVLLASIGLISARCTMPDNNIDAFVGKSLSVQIKCDEAPTSFYLYPILPKGLSYSTSTGLISGTPSVQLQNTTYTFIPKGIPPVIFTLAVYGKLSRCTYGNSGTFRFYREMPVHIDEPRCDGPVNRFVIQPELPLYMTFDTVGGLISGNASTIHNEYHTISAFSDPPSNDVVKVNVRIIVEEPVTFPSGLNARFTPDGYCSNIDDPMDIWGKFDTNQMSISYEGTIPYLWGTCSSSDCDWEENLNRGHRLYFCLKVTGYLNIDYPGQYTISVEADDTAVLFIDDYRTPVMNVSFYDDRKEFTKDFTSGLHKFGLLYHQSGGPYLLKVEWKSTSAGIPNFVRIPTNNFRNVPQPVQHLSYTSNYITLVRGINRAVEPNYKGSPISFSAESLPNGIIISDTNGTISGVPTTLSNFVAYRITADSITSTSTVSLNIRVVDVNDFSTEQGVQLRVYTALNNPCDSYPNVNDGFHPLSQSINVRTINYHFSKQPFPDLFKSNESAIITMSGFLKVPQTNSYTINIRSIDGSIIRIDKQELINLGCTTGSTVFTNSSIFYLTEGYHELLVTYIKRYHSVPYGIEITWHTPDTAQVDIPNDYLFLIPTGVMEYKSRYNRYAVGAEIDDNIIIYHTPPSTAGYSNFNVYPQLPSGLFLDSVDGRISGTPIVSVQNGVKYYVSAVSNDLVSYIYTVLTIQVSVDNRITFFYYTYENKTQLTGPVYGHIGEDIPTLLPYTIGDSAYYDVLYGFLPVNVNIDRSTGMISGKPLSYGIYEVIFTACNSLGCLETTIIFNISNCGVDYTYLFYGVFTEDASVTSTLSINHSPINTHGYSRNEFYGFGYCHNNYLNITFQVTSNSPRPPFIYFRLQDNTTMVSRQLQPFKDDFIYDTGINNDTQPSISFPVTDLVFYLHTYAYYYGDIIGGIDNSSISPALPDGLIFVRPAGITGLVRTLSEKKEYTINYVRGRQHNSTKLNIEVKRCDNGNIPFEINVRTETQGQKMKVKMYQSDNITNLIADYTGFTEYDVSSYTYCSASGNYYLELGNTDSQSWTSHSQVVIYFLEGLELFQGRYDSDRPSKILLDLNHLVPVYSTWHYSMGKNPGWETNYNFDVTSYESAMPDDFPIRSSTTVYYRRTFIFDGQKDNSSNIVIMVKYDSGILIKLNGKELYRNNLPSGKIDENTRGTKIIDVRYYHLTFNCDNLQNQNVLAVELHSHELSSTRNIFALYFDVNEFSTSVNNLNRDNAGTYEVVHKEKIGNPAINLLDDDKRTQWIAETYQTSGTTFIYRFNEHTTEYINYYVIVSGDTQQRDPKSWILWGSNDNGINYVKLDQQTEQYFYAREISYGYHFNNKASYNTFKWEILTHGDKMGSVWEGIQVADFLLYASSRKFCPTDGKWRPAAAGTTVYIPCPLGYANNMKRLCKFDAIWDSDPPVNKDCTEKDPDIIISESDNYLIPRNIEIVKITFICDALNVEYTINPELPSGLKLDRLGGYIYGKATMTTQVTLYNITATRISTKKFAIKSFKLAVNRAFCHQDLPWNQTEQGVTAEMECPNGEPGKITRYCQPANAPFWLDPIENCGGIVPSKSNGLSAMTIIGIICGVLGGIVVIFLFYKYITTRRTSTNVKSRYETLLD